MSRRQIFRYEELEFPKKYSFRSFNKTKQKYAAAPKCPNAKMPKWQNADSDIKMCAKSSKLSKTIVLSRLFHVDVKQFGFQ
jgi:hypothetical protein